MGGRIDTANKLVQGVRTWPFFISSRKRQVIIPSSVEAEFFNLSMNTVKSSDGLVTMNFKCDSRAARGAVRRERSNTWTKEFHGYKRVQEVMASGIFTLYSENTNVNKADLDTNPMQGPRLMTLRELCGP